MVAAEHSHRYTPAEYLAFERQAEDKHEYIDGYIVAMSGVSRHHDRIAGDVYGELRSQLRDGPCEIFSSALRVKNQANGRYTYPDASVVCGEARFEDDQFDTLLNPTVIIEVLSPSTEAYDRGDRVLSSGGNCHRVLVLHLTPPAGPAPRRARRPGEAAYASTLR